MSSIVISGDTSGAITLSAPAVAGTNTATLPASTGTVMVSGNMPAFSAYPSGTFSAANGVATKVPCNTELFDTANAFDSTTNYRFTPQVAGYYQISAATASSATFTGFVGLQLYKNGSFFQQFGYSMATGNYLVPAGSTLVYLNGSTDYIELYVSQSTSLTVTFNNGGIYTYFSGVLVRTA